MTPLTPDQSALADAIQSTSGCLRFAAEEEAIALVEALRDGGWFVAHEVAVPAEAKARWSDPTPSQLAAMSIDDMPARFAGVLSAASWFKAPFTYDALCDEYSFRAERDGLPQQTPQSIRSRAAKLRDARLIAKVDDAGRSDHDRPCQRWRLTPAGHDRLDALAVAS